MVAFVEGYLEALCDPAVGFAVAGEQSGGIGVYDLRNRAGDGLSWDVGVDPGQGGEEALFKDDGPELVAFGRGAFG